MIEKAPPLKLWFALSFLVFSIIFAGIIFQKLTKKENEKKYFLEYIKTASATNSKYKVLVFGSSLTGHGIACNEELTQITSNSEVNIIKIWRSGDPFQFFFADSTFVQEIIKLKPDLISIQTDVACIDLSKSKSYISDFLDRVSLNITKSLFFITHFSFFGDNKDEKKEIYSCLPSNANVIDQSLDTLKIDFRPRSIKAQNEIQEELKNLKLIGQAGISIQFVDIPRPVEIEKQVNSSEFVSELNLLLKFYQENASILHIPYDGKTMFFKDFIDGGHLNEEGRNYYTKWYLSKINERQHL